MTKPDKLPFEKLLNKSSVNPRVVLMPAAVNSLALNSFLGVRHGRPKKPYTSERIKGLHTIYLKDRTVFVGRGNGSTFGIPDYEFDQATFLSPLTAPDRFKEAGYNMMMVTPERLATSDYVRRNGKVLTVSDSGGFQLSKGVTDFMDLDEVSHFYANKINIGIGMDIPVPRHLQSTDWFLRMCKVMLANNKYIAKKIKGTGCELYDVSHGLTLENRKTFLDYVLTHKVGSGLAMGGIGQANYDNQMTSLTASVINMSYVLSKSKGVYDRFHILGTMSPLHVALYNILTLNGTAPMISADSSTYGQASLSFWTRGTIISRSSQVVASPVETLAAPFGNACNCPVCALSGDIQVFRMSQDANAIHTLFVQHRQFEIIGSMTAMYVKGQLPLDELLAMIQPRKAMWPLLRMLVAFVMDMDKGFDKAWTKHGAALKEFMRKNKEDRGLFSKAAALNEFHKKAEANVTKAIVRYEQFHNLGGKKGKAK
jgi:hypothetical protein